MTSKKKSNSAFRTTFLAGSIILFFFLAFAVFLIAAYVNSYIEKNSTREITEEVKEERPITPKQIVRTDTIYVTKTVVEKCTKMHCDVEISHVDSPIVETKQHDSTNN